MSTYPSLERESLGIESEDRGDLFLTYMDESLLGLWRVRLQNKLDSVCNATLVHSYHRWLEDDLWDPAWRNAWGTL